MILVKSLENTKCKATKENLDKLLSITKNTKDDIRNALIYDAYFYIKGGKIHWGHKKCINHNFWDSFATIHLVNGRFHYTEETVIKEKPKNNFEEYGFEADFEGEILKEYENQFVGMVYQNEGNYGCSWNKEGKCLQTKGFGYIDMNLKPIKKEWYENPDNFPCIVYSLKLNEYIVLDNPLVPLKLNDEFRPATKEEILTLLIKED